MVKSEEIGKSKVMAKSKVMLESKEMVKSKVTVESKEMVKSNVISKNCKNLRDGTRVNCLVYDKFYHLSVNN